ncbi:hypothetical protein [Cupriavidus basilensis]|uniref:hypothetical protein n=1 Tax=Cupriavidus basilensis TaxID=68895 RepID=UPI001187263D|nr:hypothetical protein [Cupriavidus basilensis]
MTPILALMLVPGAVHAQLTAYKASGSAGYGGYGGYAAASQQHGGTAYGSAQGQGNSLSGVNGAITQRYSNATSGHQRDELTAAQTAGASRDYGGGASKTSLNPSTARAQPGK